MHNSHFVLKEKDQSVPFAIVRKGENLNERIKKAIQEEFDSEIEILSHEYSDLYSEGTIVAKVIADGEEEIRDVVYTPITEY